eukprot:7762031-Alexandrium_andersonii.AAC.1
MAPKSGLRPTYNSPGAGRVLQLERGSARHGNWATRPSVGGGRRWRAGTHSWNTHWNTHCAKSLRVP